MYVNFFKIALGTQPQQPRLGSKGFPGAGNVKSGGRPGKTSSCVAEKSEFGKLPYSVLNGGLPNNVLEEAVATDVS